jgi:hypothetical protein
LGWLAVTVPVGTAAAFGPFFDQKSSPFQRNLPGLLVGEPAASHLSFVAVLFSVAWLENFFPIVGLSYSQVHF